MTYELYTSSVEVKPGETKVEIPLPFMFMLRKFYVAPRSVNESGFWYNVLKLTARYKIPFTRRWFTRILQQRTWRELEGVTIKGIEVGNFRDDKGDQLLAGGPYDVTIFNPTAFGIQFEPVQAQGWIRFEFSPHEKHFFVSCIVKAFSTPN